MASALQLNSDTALALVCATTALRRRSSRPTQFGSGGGAGPQLPRRCGRTTADGLRPVAGGRRSLALA